MSDTANVIAAYVAELEALRVALRLQTEAAEHSERECQRLSGLLKEKEEAVERQFVLLESLRFELRETRKDLDEDDRLRTEMFTLLTGTANALKGEPPDFVWHDWSDLPTVAAKTVEMLANAQAEAKELGKVVDMLQHPEGQSP